MRYICSFCNIEYAPPVGDGALISHGICRICYNHARASLGVDLREFLDMLDHPVVLVDHDVRVLSSNEKAAALVKKERAEMIGRFGGEVFECENASLPEGCGRTVHCSGCVIRESVNETYETGNPVICRPAALYQGVPGYSFPVELVISTRKSGDVVFLMVEQVSV